MRTRSRAEKVLTLLETRQDGVEEMASRSRIAAFNHSREHQPNLGALEKIQLGARTGKKNTCELVAR